MTTISIITMSAGWQWVVEQVGTFSDDKRALEFVNEHAKKWFEDGKAIAAASNGKGVFEINTNVKTINGVPEFNTLRYTPYMEANDGEETWMAVLDRESQERIYHETSPIQDPNGPIMHDHKPVPEGVTIVGLSDPEVLHNTIKDAIGE